MPDRLQHLAEGRGVRKLPVELGFDIRRIDFALFELGVCEFNSTMPRSRAVVRPLERKVDLRQAPLFGHRAELGFGAVGGARQQGVGRSRQLSRRDGRCVGH